MSIGIILSGLYVLCRGEQRSGEDAQRMLSRRVAADAGHEMAHQMGTSTREIEAQVRDDEGPPSPTARAAQ